jgi:DNA-binding GntR family transcriptional regulator
VADKRAPGGTRADDLRHRIEAAIIEGKLLPGQKLDEQVLAAKFKVSRTPVREALRLLASTGLVEKRPRLGAVVATLTLPRLIEMFQVMAELEGLCARLAARRITPEEKRRLEASHHACRRAVEADDPESFYAGNKTFHETIYAASRNHFLDESTRALRNQIAPHRRYITYQPGRMADSIGEHEAVMQAIAGGDGERAAALMRQHVNILGDNLVDLISTMPGLAVPATGAGGRFAA